MSFVLVSVPTICAAINDQYLKPVMKALKALFTEALNLILVIRYIIQGCCCSLAGCYASPPVYDIQNMSAYRKERLEAWF